MMQQTTPMADKYYMLTKNLDKNMAKDLHPNEEEQKSIEMIINLPDFIPISEEHKAIIWIYRYSLKDKGKALVKFL